MTSTETAKDRFKFNPAAISVIEAETVDEAEAGNAFASSVPKDHPLWTIYQGARESGAPVRVRYAPETPFAQVQAFFRKCAAETGNGLRIKEQEPGVAIIKVGEKRKHVRKETTDAKPAAKRTRTTRK